MTYSKSSMVKAFVLVASVFTTHTLAAAESAEPIKIAVNNWSSQQVLTHVSGTLLKRMGYNVEFHPSDVEVQFQAIGNGDLHLQMEVWQGTMAALFEQQIARKRMVDAGSHTATTREEWWYPDYMESICPGLPDWKALNACSEKLATASTKPLGRYLSGPVDWGRPDRERIEALGLNFDVAYVSNASDLWSELETATREQTPIVLMNWTPNWTEDKYPGKFVEFPEYQPECHSDASWGENPNLTHDCGNPREGWLKKGVWSGFADKWSCAFELVQNINFDNKQLATAAGHAEIYEMSPEEAANRWLSENPLLWEKWVPACADGLSIATSETASTEKPAEPDNSAAALALAKSKNCLACHTVNTKLVGPAFVDVAKKYKGDATASDKLVDRIKNGVVGNWGNIPMPANPAVSGEELKILVEWVLGVD